MLIVYMDPLIDPPWLGHLSRVESFEESPSLLQIGSSATT